METLVKIVKVLGGIERHYRIEEQGRPARIVIRFEERPIVRFERLRKAA